MPGLFTNDSEQAAYAELSIRWIGICCLEQDLAAGVIAAHNVDSSRRELANRKRVYEERLESFSLRCGEPAAAKLRTRVESEKVVSTLRAVPDVPATARRASRPQQTRVAPPRGGAAGWVQQGLPLIV